MYQVYHNCTFQPNHSETEDLTVHTKGLAVLARPKDCPASNLSPGDK